MGIIKTTEEDFECVMKIHSYAREFMAKTGNPNQWGSTNSPPEEQVRYHKESLTHK